jgi:hypothetical protein
MQLKYIIIFLFSFQTSNAQRPLGFYVVNPDSGALLTNPYAISVSIFDSTYILGIRALDSTTYWSSAYFSLIDLNGKLIKSINYGGPENQLTVIKPSRFSSSGLLTYCHQYWLFDSLENKYSANGGLVQIDSTLNITLVLNLMDSVVQTWSMWHILELPDGSFLLDISDRGFDKPVRLMKVNEKAETIWLKEILDTVEMRRTGDLIQTSDGNLLMCALAEKVPYWLPDTDITVRPYITKFDSSGQVIWQRIMPGSRNFSMSHVNLVPLLNNEFAYDYFHKDYFLDSGHPVRIYGCDSVGEQKWVVGFNDFKVTYQMYELSTTRDGDIIGCGTSYSHPEPNDFDYYGWIFKISKNGERLWSRHYTAVDLFPNQFYSNLTFIDVQEAPDKSLILTGRVIDETNNYVPMLLILDENGCISENCNEDSIPNFLTQQMELMPQERIAFGLSPNPTTGETSMQIDEQVNLEALTFEVYSASGKLIRNQNVSQYHSSLIFRDLVIGTYFGILKRNGVQVGITTFVKM